MALYTDEAQKKPKWRNVKGADISPETFNYNAISEDINNLRNLDLNAPNVNYDYTRGVQNVFNLNDLQNPLNRLNSQTTANAPNINYDYRQGNQNVYNLTDLQDTLNRLNAAPQQQYQTTDQLTNLMNTWLGAMQPYLNSNQQVAQSQLNQNLGNLQSQWANRGLLGTTAAAATEQDMANQYALQSQNQLNQATMEALAQAFNYANLGLNEQQLGLQQNQAGYDAMLNALNMQNQMNAQNVATNQQQAQDQFSNWLNTQNLSLDQSQALMNAYLSALGTQETMNQNTITNNRNMAQDRFTNWANAMGLNLQQRQAVVDAMMSGANLESQNQQSSFNNNMANAQMAYQTQQDYINNLGNAANFIEQQRQYDNSLREQQRQFNFNNAQNWSQLFGQYVTPVSSGAALQQQLQGRTTPQYQQIRSAITGVDPLTGQQTLDAQQMQQQIALQYAQLRQQAANAAAGRAMSPMDMINLQLKQEELNQMRNQQQPLSDAYQSVAKNFLNDLNSNPNADVNSMINQYQQTFKGLLSGGLITQKDYDAAMNLLNTYKQPAAPPKQSWIQSIFSTPARPVTTQDLNRASHIQAVKKRNGK